jgi:hypothetical protein
MARTEPGQARERRDPGEVDGAGARRRRESNRMLFAGVNHSVP